MLSLDLTRFSYFFFYINHSQQITYKFLNVKFDFSHDKQNRLQFAFCNEEFK